MESELLELPIPLSEGCFCMSQQLSLEDKCRLLQLALDEDLQRKRAVEARIRRRVKELKKLEATVEKANKTTRRRDLGDERSKSWLE